MEDNETHLARLEHAVRTEPTDHRARRRLIEVLIDTGDFDAANLHLSFLSEALPEEPWVLVLGLQVASESGDKLSAARYRRALRHVLDEDELEELSDPSRHPSHVQQRERLPRLRLLTGQDEPEAPAAQGAVPPASLSQIVGPERSNAVLRDMQASICESRGKVSTSWLGGLLLYGPPGCGKAFAAVALAGELQAPFWLFNLHNGWDTELLRKTIADVLRRHGDGPAFCYFDNLDAHPGSRGSVLLEPLLPMLDSASASGRLVILGAATYPWHVSAGLVTPERLGHVLLMLPPDPPARRQFLESRLAAIGELPEEELDWIVSHTEGFSFADLESYIKAVAAASASEPVAQDRYRFARRRVAPSSSDWLSTAGHHAMLRPSNGIYDDLLAYFHARTRT